jgi:prevent-host-death family protein
VGIRELHDRLSEHLARVQGGAEVVVTRRGRPIARLSAVDGEDPLDDLVRRGLVTPALRSRRARRAGVKARGSVSELVAEQRR